MPSDLTQLGVAAAVVIIILREIFGFLKSRNGLKVELPERYLEHFDLMCGKINALYEWHGVTDGSGNKIWYNNNGAFQDAVRELSAVIAKQGIVLDRIANRLLDNAQLNTDGHTRIEVKLDKIIERG